MNWGCNPLILTTYKSWDDPPSTLFLQDTSNGPFHGAEEPFYVGQLRKFDAERSAGSIACKEAVGSPLGEWENGGKLQKPGISNLVSEGGVVNSC